MSTEHHHVAGIQFVDDWLVLEVDGREERFRLGEISPVLDRASEAERNVFEISPSGYGIHWPLLNEDLSIDALLGIVHRPKVSPRSV